MFHIARKKLTVKKITDIAGLSNIYLNMNNKLIIQNSVPIIKLTPSY